MSTMLEQAIIDASALKEAAIKNAEQAIVEKYAPEIKKAVANLLEQEEDLGLEDDPMAMGDEMGDMGAGEADPAAVPDIPRADAAGEKLCPCPDDEDVVEIDFDQLVQDMAGEEAGMESQEDLAADMPALEEQFEIDTLALEDLVEGDLDIDDAIIKALVEKVTVDMSVVPAGNGHAASQYTPEYQKAHAEDVALALEADTSEDDEDEEKKELEESLRKLRSTTKHKNSQIKDLKEALAYLKGKLEEVNLSNAKLLYTNRVLTSTSLNERQITKIVDAIENADSVEEAKVIYETLQSTMGDRTVRNKNPKSLSEAVRRGSSTMLPRRNSRNNNSTDDFTKNRWKRLAGIK